MGPGRAEVIAEAFRRALEDDRHGAAEIERRLLVALLAEPPPASLETWARGLDAVAEAHPVMANLRSLARLTATTTDADELRGRLAARLDLVVAAPARLAAAARPLFRGCSRVLTLSRSSSVAAVLEGAQRRGWRGEVVVFDASPAGGGEAQARVLAEVGLAVRSQPDATMAAWCRPGALVLAGADALSTERVVNACGTGLLAVLAGRESLPVAVVADSTKDLDDADLDPLLAAARRAAEDGPGRSWAVFEAVPRTLFGLRVDETGVRTPEPRMVE